MSLREKIQDERDKLSDFLIHSLWILNSDSGVCLFEQLYRDITTEQIHSDLIVGFFSALLSFAQESFAKEIKHITMQDLRFFFDSDNYYIYIATTSDDIKVSNEKVKKILVAIKEKFGEKYKSIMEKGWDGNIAQFRDFSEDLREIVKQEPTRLKLVFSLIDKQREYMREKRKQFRKKFDRFLK